jgi:hypothetical protein
VKPRAWIVALALAGLLTAGLSAARAEGETAATVTNLPAGPPVQPVDGTATATTVANPDGSYTTTLLPTPVKYGSGDGLLREIDTSLTRGPSDLSADLGSLTVSMPLNGADEVSLSLPSGNVGWRLENAASSNAAVSSNELLYPRVAPHTDLAYHVIRNGIKETLILRSSNAPADFTFDLRIPDGLTPVQRGPRVALVDSRDTVQLWFDTPLMQDASADVANLGAVEMTLEGSRESGYFLALAADGSWLSAAGRAFPVALDPTATIPSPSIDCWAQSGTSGTQQSCTGTGLNVGYNSNGLRRAFLLFATDGIPVQAQVSSATLTLWLTGQNNTRTLALEGDPLLPDPLAPTWDGGLTWATRDGTTAWGTAGGDFPTSPNATLSSVGGSGVTLPQQYNMDLTSIASGWVNAAFVNEGLLLRQQGDTSATNGNILTFASSEATNSAQWPQLQVTYSLDYPTVSSLSASPSSAASGQTITFQANWSAAGHQAVMVVCRTNAVYLAKCPAGSWTQGTLSGTSPVSASLATNDSMIGISSYYAFVCTELELCTSAGSGSFTVSSPSSGPLTATGLQPTDMTNSSSLTPTLSGTFSTATGTDSRSLTRRVRWFPVGPGEQCPRALRLVGRCPRA